jgi:hypothetical protein
MKSTDRFLIAIIAGVLLLVAVALLVAVRQPPLTYRPDGAPDSVAFNYLLALQRNDYARALAGLSPRVAGSPGDAQALAADVHENRYMFQMDENMVAFSPDPAQVSAETATVLVHETRFYQGQLFNSGETTDTFEMRLGQAGGAWTIVSADRYWLPCWEQANGCHNPAPKQGG